MARPANSPARRDHTLGPPTQAGAVQTSGTAPKDGLAVLDFAKSYLKANAAEVLLQLQENREPLVTFKIWPSLRQRRKPWRC